MKRKQRPIIMVIILILSSNLFIFSASAASDPSCGYVDLLNQDISGWVYNPSNPNKSIDVHVYIKKLDGTTVWAVPVTASNFREDLYNLGWGNGNHGFSFSIPWREFDWSSIPDYLLNVTVYAVDGDYTSHPIILDSSTIQNPLLNGSLSWPISDLSYYLYDETYAYQIERAAYNWTYPICGYNSLYPCTRTYNNSYSAIDIYSYNDTDDGLNGYTLFIRDDCYTNPDIYDYDYCFIYLNYDSVDCDPDSANYVQAVVAHEMGHVFGLNENNSNRASIMCQASHGRLVRRVQFVDAYAFNVKN